MAKPLKKLIDFEPAINQALQLRTQHKKPKETGVTSTEITVEASSEQLEKFVYALYDINRA